MNFGRWRQVFAGVLLSVLLIVTGCNSQPPSRFEQTQIETSQRGAPPAVANEAEQGSSFNKFFPKSQDGYKVVPAQEKKGFAQYKLYQGDVNVAMLSVNDTTSNPAAAQKYDDSTRTIGGYKALDVGANQTSVLVGKFQVKVQSRDESFTVSDREAWLEKFDLDGLSKLQ